MTRTDLKLVAQITDTAQRIADLRLRRALNAYVAALDAQLIAKKAYIKNSNSEDACENFNFAKAEVAVAFAAYNLQELSANAAYCAVREVARLANHANLASC